MVKTLALFSILFANFAFANEMVTTYFKTPFMEATAASEALKKNEFEVLGTHAVNGDKDLQVIVVTHPDLVNTASKEDRGFAAVLRVLVNKKQNEIKVSNPEYFLKAFMQKEYDEAVATKMKTLLGKALGELSETDDKLKAKSLAKYHFMMGMPYYDDFEVVGEGSHDELLAALKKKAAGKIVFEKKIADGKTLVGVALSQKVEGFPTKLKQPENAGLLPYTVLIQDDKAMIMHAKYFIALSFPRLGMGQFMTISDIPGKIEDEFESYFQ